MKQASLTRSSCIVNSNTIDYWDSESNKPVLVLLHGFGATTKFQWYKQVKELSKSHRVILPNLLHFGLTKGETPKFEISDQVDMVHDFIEFLGIDSYILGGVSYGGLIAIEMVSKYPKGISKLILIDAPIKYVSEEDIENVKKSFDVNSVEELFVPAHVKDLKKLIYLAYMKKSFIPSKWLSKFHEELYQKNLGDMQQLISTLINSLSEYQKHNYSHIDIPVLLIWGSNDPIVPVNCGTQLQEHIGINANYVVIKNGAHMPSLTKSRKFNRIVSEFLKN